MGKTDRYISVEDIGTVCHLHEEGDIEIFELVRCKDCKWCKMQLTHNGEIDRRYKQHFCNFFETDIELNFYCAAGERKENE